MRVHNPQDVRSVCVEIQVRARIAGRATMPLDDLPLQVHHDQICRCQLVITESGRLDHHQVRLGVAAAHCAAMHGDQLVLGQFQQAFKYLFTQLLKH
jgi:hypothetical protein